MPGQRDGHLIFFPEEGSLLVWDLLIGSGRSTGGSQARLPVPTLQLLALPNGFWDSDPRACVASISHASFRENAY